LLICGPLLGDNGSGNQQEQQCYSYTLQVAPTVSALPTGRSAPERDNGHALLLGEE